MIIAGKDPDWRVRRDALFSLADVMNGTVLNSIIAARRKNILERIGDQDSIGYKYSETSNDRLIAVENLDSETLTDEQIVSLKIIAQRDPHWRVRNEAFVVLNGDMTVTMIESIHKKALEGVGDHDSIGYKHSEAWYGRLDALNNLNVSKLTNEQIASLRIIKEKDPDWRVQDYADSLLKNVGQESLGDFVLRKVYYEIF